MSDLEEKARELASSVLRKGTYRNQVTAYAEASTEILEALRAVERETLATFVAIEHTCVECESELLIDDCDYDAPHCEGCSNDPNDCDDPDGVDRRLRQWRAHRNELARTQLESRND